MSEFNPVSTKEDLEMLDMDDIVSGYRSGFCGDEEPGSDKSRGFWHGWRNGKMDRGDLPQDEASMRLVRELYPNINPKLS